MFWEFFWFFGEFFGKCQWLFTFLKVNWFLKFSKSADCCFTLLKSADFLHSKSQLITKRIWKELICLSRFCLNGEGRKDKKFRSLELGEPSLSHLRILKILKKIKSKFSIQQQRLLPQLDSAHSELGVSDNFIEKSNPN